MSLFRLKVNGEFVVMPDTKVSINIKSPVFKKEGEGRTRTYTFKIAAAPNESIFKLSGFLNTRDIQLEYDAEAYFGETFYRKCKVTVTGFNGDFYELRAVMNPTVYDLYKDKLLNQFKYERPTRSRAFQPACIYYDFQFTLAVGAPTTGSTYLLIDLEQIFFSYFKKTYTIIYNAGETLSVFMSRVVEEINADFRSHGYWLNIQSSNTIRFTDNWSNGYRNDPSFTPIDLDYFYYLDNVTNTSFYSPNFGLQAISHANAVVAAPNNFDYVFAPIYMAQLDNTVKVANLWQPDVYDLYGPGFRSMQGSATPDSNKRNTLIPMPYLYSVIELIHQELGIQIDDQFFDDELKKLVLVPNVIFSDNYNLTFHNINFQYADLVPDFTLYEFIKQLENLFCIVFDYDSKEGYVRIVKKKDILKSKKVQNLTNSFTKSYSYRERFYSIEKGIGYTFNEDESIIKNDIGLNYLVESEVTDLPINAQYNSYVLKKSDNFIYRFTGVWLAAASGIMSFYNKLNQEIEKLQISTFERKSRSDNYINSRKINWIIPYTLTPIYSYGTKKEKNQIRLLFYRGMQPCSFEKVTDGSTLNGTYPMLDYHNYNRNNVRVGEYSLSFYGDDGLYNKFHKAWNLFFTKTKQLELSLVFNSHQLSALDLLAPIMIENQIFLISELDLQINNNLIFAKARAFKLINNGTI